MPVATLMKTYQQIRTGIKFTREIWKHCRPTESFSEEQIPEGRDYSAIDAWAAHPSKPHKAHLVPEGTTPSTDQPADVFFIHPTSYFGKDNWNQPIGAYPSTEIIDEVIMPGQASVFNGACKIYAPYYRQATFYSFLSFRKANARKALELAYTDILRAFDHYVEHENKGRPFVLAGHSQGTLMLIKLLEERIERDGNLRARFVAAYAIGFQFPKDKFGTTFKKINISTTATDTGCVIAYDTYSYRGGPSHNLDKVEIWNGSKWRKRAHHKVVGVNPLSWNTSTLKANEQHNLGAVHTVYNGKGYSVQEWFGNEKIGLDAASLSKPYPEVVSAELDKDGFLFINTPKPKIFNVALLPGYNYHNYDYALFYMNLRQNVMDRVGRFTNK